MLPTCLRPHALTSAGGQPAKPDLRSVSPVEVAQHGHDQERAHGQGDRGHDLEDYDGGGLTHLKLPESGQLQASAIISGSIWLPIFL